MEGITIPRNVYFSQGTRSEQWLYEDLIIEALKIYGHDMYYLPRSIVTKNKLFTEEAISKFASAFRLECYIESIEGFGGDGVLMSKFGLQIRDQMSIAISRRRWDQLVGRFNIEPGKLPRPAEGDLVFFPLANALMEVKFVENKAPFFQLQNLPTYKLNLEMFEYSGEDIETGVESIDDFQLIFSNPIELTISSMSGDFIRGESVTCIIDSSVMITAEIVSLKDDKLTVVNVKTNDTNYHDFTGPIIGDASGATATVLSVDKLTGMESADHTAQNKVFEDIGNDIIDFTESNPFGEANYRS